MTWAISCAAMVQCNENAIAAITWAPKTAPMHRGSPAYDSSKAAAAMVRDGLGCCIPPGPSCPPSLPPEIGTIRVLFPLGPAGVNCCVSATPRAGQLKPSAVSAPSPPLEDGRRLGRGSQFSSIKFAQHHPHTHSRSLARESLAFHLVILCHRDARSAPVLLGWGFALIGVDEPTLRTRPSVANSTHWAPGDISAASRMPRTEPALPRPRVGRGTVQEEHGHARGRRRGARHAAADDRGRSE